MAVCVAMLGASCWCHQCVCETLNICRTQRFPGAMMQCDKQVTTIHLDSHSCEWPLAPPTFSFLSCNECLLLTRHRRLLRYAPRWMTAPNRVERPPASSPLLPLSSILGCSMTREKTSFFFRPISAFDYCYFFLLAVSSLQFIPLSTWWQTCPQI